MRKYFLKERLIVVAAANELMVSGTILEIWDRKNSSCRDPDVHQGCLVHKKFLVDRRAPKHVDRAALLQGGGEGPGFLVEAKRRTGLGFLHDLACPVPFDAGGGDNVNG